MRVTTWLRASGNSCPPRRPWAMPQSPVRVLELELELEPELELVPALELELELKAT